MVLRKKSQEKGAARRHRSRAERGQEETQHGSSTGASKGQEEKHNASQGAENEPSNLGAGVLAVRVFFCTF